ncbi:MAG TPA: RNA polymerase-binding protein DksA [Gammaproteobacteria bacterium]|nr:RNA polymerase-binding protein DksA [Gammaproteobacteria bacterium]
MGKAAARKKAPARKAPAARKPAAKKAASAKAPARKTSTKKTAKKTPVKKSSVKKTPSSKKATPAKKVAAKKTASRKAVPKKSAASKTIAKKGPAKKPAAARTAAKKKVVVKKGPAKKAPARKAAGKKTAATKSAARKVLAGKKPLAVNPDQPEPSFGFSGPLKSFKPYQPAPGEDYMSDSMLEHFRNILQTWRQELMEEVDRTVHHMKDEAANFPDPNDRATQESEFGLELRTRDRERKLLKKIDQALGRIDDGSYGYCSETGEEIGLRRLEARPVATLTVEAQERRELAEKQYRDRDDR